jgi:hypothetical protein
MRPAMAECWKLSYVGIGLIGIVLNVDRFCGQRGKMIASHGPIRCSRCWPNEVDKLQECGPFRLVRDPGYWGATDPQTLVLGISKGNTQSKAFGSEPFENVAFKDIRHRVLEVLQSVGLLQGETVSDFQHRFTADERDYAFASVVRCSITGMNPKKGTHTAESPYVLPAFRSGSPGRRFVENCIDQYLKVLSPRTRLVLLLGNTDAYIEALADVIGHARAPIVRSNPIAYNSGGVQFVHVAHPSKGNGHFGAFIRGEGTPGAKRDWAREALGLLAR